MAETDRSRRFGRRAPTWAGLLVAALAAGGPSALGDGRASAPDAASRATSRAEAAGLWSAAADAVRQRDFDGAVRMIEPLAATGDSEGRETLLVLGLWAHAAEQVEHAAELLHRAADPRGRFEDWRRLVLADCHAALGRLPAAAATLEPLLDEQRNSPLAPRAVLRMVEIAGRLGDWQRARTWLDHGRRQPLTAAQAAELETVAWQLALDSGDPAAQRESARRLLVEHPLIASRNQVIELFRQPSGALDWPSFLTVDELLARARSLLAVGITAGALETLEAVPERRRGAAWALTRAHALTLDGRGLDALAVLAPVRPASPAEAVELEQRRAAALFDAAGARRGRPLLPAAERERLRHEGRRALWRVLEVAGQRPELRDAALGAHRRLLAELLDEERVDPALGLLRSLRTLDPGDTSGARFLWQRGWAEYRRRNFSGAVGYFAELEAIYGGTSYARAGRYWTARAYDNLGDRQRAEALFREVASVASDDFYRRHALARLDSAQRPTAAPREPREPWPTDPALGRARWLSDRGLDQLALDEIEAVGERSDRRAADALAAVVLARAGRTRDSIHRLARAFPQLGGLAQSSAPEAALRLYYPLAYEPIVDRFAAAHRLPKTLLLAMIRQESAFDADAVSRSGARGLMQLMPATGAELARRLRLRYSTARLSEPEFNIRLGTTYFRQLLDMFGGNEQLALAGYNGGPYRIKRLWHSEGSAGELDLFLESLALEETKTYVKRILLFSDSYDRLYADSA